MKKSWHLNRRHFLRGVGAMCALPYLECMGESKTTRPKRMCAIFFPYGVGLPPVTKKELHENWHWFPHVQGKNYKLTNSLKPLEGLRQDMTILGGLSHPAARTLAHAQGDVWLTGADISNSYDNNSASLDQVAAETLGKHTRIDSLTLSTVEGIGHRGRARTLGHDRSGRAISSMEKPRAIFDYMFSHGSKTDQLKRIQSRKRLVDTLLEDFKNTRKNLGKADQAKMDEYFESLKEVENGVLRAEKWTHIPPPDVDANDYVLDVTSREEPAAYYRAMFDLIHLAFRTDMTRVSSFMMGSEGGGTDAISSKVCGMAHHKMTHARAFDKLGVFDAFLAEQLRYFIDKLKATQDEHGNLLDSTAVLYGSGTSTLHLAKNYPLILAGGKDLGFRHGSYQVFPEKVPFSNLLLSILHAVGAKEKSFADSTGQLEEVFG